MEKRILVAFLLSLAVLYGFRALYGPQPTVPIAPQTQEPVPASPESSAKPESSAEQQSPSGSSPGKVIQAERAENVMFESALYDVTISNRGAVLRSFKPKLYTDGKGSPIDLIDANGAEKLGWPLAMVTADPKLNELLASADFLVTREGNGLELEYADGSVHARKTMTFEPDNYDLVLTTSLTRDGKAVPHEIVWQSGFGDQSITPDPAKRFVVYPEGSALTKTAVASLEDKALMADRVGVEDQYFLAMFRMAGSGGIKLRKQEYPGSDGKPVATSHISIDAQEQPTRIYIGPKDQKALAKADPRLFAVIDYDYGYFGFIAKPLTRALFWIHSYIGNFGWAIIVLTVLINLLLFPLRLKQQSSMLKMQTIQPQMRTLQDKYKKLKPNDPKRAEVQSQMMGLYKEHGVNPMGGCLPLLLQMPFLMAFWSMLNAAIELRQAPWILWIRDLSVPDPYFIMPIIMAVSMVVQQKMTPNPTMDPMQARMMLIMPLMFSVLFLWAQSGLMLYWLTSNLVGIGQQVFINKYWAPPPKKGRSKKNEPEE